MRKNEIHIYFIILYISILFLAEKNKCTFDRFYNNRIDFLQQGTFITLKIKVSFLENYANSKI